jgi:hypothetical protein
MPSHRQSRVPHPSESRDMKILLIGGVTTQPSQETEHKTQSAIVTQSMARLGKDLVSAGHDLLVCSPFSPSADVDAVTGAAPVLRKGDGPSVEFHYPGAPEVELEVTRLTESLSLKNFCRFPHPLIGHLGSKDQRSYAWLLPQLSAMDRSHAIIALGGRIEGSTSLLLALADSRQKPMLPLTFLGGAAADAFQRRRYQLEDRLGEAVAVLSDPGRVAETITLVEQLADQQFAQSPKTAPRRFFISYPQCRPQEADFVEVTLRRRHLDVFRDAHDFGAGRPLLQEIMEHVHGAHVFVALWCREYACSPWCFDELEIALTRHAAGKILLWLLCLDDTRMVPPVARNLVNYPAKTREELEKQLLTLLERLRL